MTKLKIAVIGIGQICGMAVFFAYLAGVFVLFGSFDLGGDVPALAYWGLFGVLACAQLLAVSRTMRGETEGRSWAFRWSGRVGTAIALCTSAAFSLFIFAPSDGRNPALDDPFLLLMGVLFVVATFAHAFALFGLKNLDCGQGLDRTPHRVDTRSTGGDEQ